MMKVSGRVTENTSRVLQIVVDDGREFYITTTMCPCDAKKGERVTVLIDKPAHIAGAPPLIFVLKEVIDVTPVSHPAGTGIRSSSDAPNGRPSSSSFSVHRAA